MPSYPRTHGFYFELRRLKCMKLPPAVAEQLETLMDKLEERIDPEDSLQQSRLVLLSRALAATERAHRVAAKEGYGAKDGDAHPLLERAHRFAQQASDLVSKIEARIDHVAKQQREQKTSFLDRARGAS